MQNDLTTAFFVAVALFFGSRALDVGVPGALLAGASFGLALGTKPTAALALPAFALFLAARVRSRGGPWPWRRLGQLCASGALGVALLGSYVYVQNVRRFGSPSGPPVFRDLMSPSRPSPRDLWSNGARLALRLLDPAGSVPPDTRAASWLVRGYGRVQDEWFRRLSVAPSIPADFRASAGGVSTACARTRTSRSSGPSTVRCSSWVRPGRWCVPRGDPRMRALGAGTLLYLAGIATVFRYQQFHGRLLLTAAAIGGPLLGIAFRDRPGWARQASNLLLASACVSALVACVLYNDRKPFFGPSSVWATGDRVSRMRTGQPGLDATLRLLERLPPGRLAVLPLQPDAASYPYFGRHLDRPVTLIHAGHLASLSAAALPEADYLLAAADLQYVYVEGERPAAPASPWVDVLDPSLLRRELRGGASGWLTLFDAEVLGDPLVLFAHRFDRATAAAGRPGVLNPQPEPYPDGWAHPVFRIPVLLDQARRVLVVSGDPLPSALPVRLVASLPSGETLARFRDGARGTLHDARPARRRPRDHQRALHPGDDHDDPWRDRARARARRPAGPVVGLPTVRAAGRRLMLARLCLRARVRALHADGRGAGRRCGRWNRGSRSRVVTAAPAFLFEGLEATVQALACDVGLVQRGPLVIDEDATAAECVGVPGALAGPGPAGGALARRVGRAGRAGRHPPIAFAAAQAAGVPSLALGNFSWDWIYRELAHGRAGMMEAADAAASSYGSAGLLLELPFAGDLRAFRAASASQ